jgi:hypothetical protein
MSESTQPYQPDPTLVRECARRIIEGQIEQIRDLGAMDVGEMCMDEIADLREPDMDLREAHAAGDVLIDAVREDIKAATISHGWIDQFPTVTICGSMRFYPRMLKLAAELTSSGRIVLMPHDASLTGIPDKTASEHGAMLDAMHRAKIRASQSVHVVNTGGYVGESTRSEIAYATSLGIPVEYDEAPEASAPAAPASIATMNDGEETP